MAPLNTLPQEPLLQVKRDIQTMKTRGAGAIGKEAAHALARAAQAYPGEDTAELRRLLLEAARLLASARPTAVTLRNGLNRMLGAAQDGDDVDTIRRALHEAAESYARSVDDAKRRIQEHALDLFQPGDVVLTHCHSTAAGGAIAHAARHLDGVRVYSTETRPFRQGLIQAPALAREGVDVTLIVDSAVALVMESEGVTRVVVGADTVGADGSLYNKVGTRQVATMAKAFGIPFLVCAERDKFSPYTLDGSPVPIEERDPREVAEADQVPGVKIHNPVFDRTPPELIHAYVTEHGPLAPDKVRAFIEKEFRDVPLRI